ERARWEKAVDEYRHRRASVVANPTKPDDLPVNIGERLKQEEAAENKRLYDAFEEALSMAPRTLDNAGPPTPPAPGEVMLLCQPVQDGWVGFAITRDRVAFRHLAKTDRDTPPEIAARLLDAFSDVLKGAERIRFAPHGKLSDVDFHALPFKGRRLLDLFTVTY